MKTTLLLPNKYKKIGWMIFIPGLIFGLLLIFKVFEFNDSIFKIKVFQIIGKEFGFFVAPGEGGRIFFSFRENNIIDEILALFIIVGGFLVGFSKEKDEDEFIAHTRLESLLWSIYINYGFLLLSILFIYGEDFIYVWDIAMFSTLIIFIFRFNFILYKNSRMKSNEE